MSSLLFPVSRLAAGLTALSFLATPALADTLTVSPQGELSTIQAGVDAAAAGDTIHVKPGTYLEVVTIPAGRDDLRLVAKGKVVVDARPDGGSGSGPAFVVESDDVTLQGFTIRHAGPGNGMDGYGVFTMGHNLSVLKCTLQHCEDGGVRSDSVSGLTVIGSSFFACGGVAIFGDGDETFAEKNRVRQCGGGIEAYGSNARALSNTIESVGSDAIMLDGDGAQAIGNTVNDCVGVGVYISGESAWVEKNRIFGASDIGINITGVGADVLKNGLEAIDGHGIDVEGEGALVASNRLANVAGRGIKTTGAHIVIDKNTVDTTFSTGIQHAGSGCVITRNTVRSVLDFGQGIDVAIANEGEISSNKLSRIGGNGIRVTDGSSEVFIAKNSIDRAGTEGGDGIRVEGKGHEIAGNKITGAMRDGIHTEGDGQVIRGNKVSGAGEDGIDLDSGESFHVFDNRVSNCLAEGIENNAIDSVVEDNRSTGNRTDFADNGSLASFVGNQSSDGTHGEAGKVSIDS